MAICGCLRKFWKAHTLWLPLLIPVLAAPLPLLGQTSVAKCGFCVIVIGVYWVTEVIPLAVTSLLPVVLFPVFGVMTARDVCRAYVQDTLMLFLGSLIVAVAVEKWNLHKRLALRTLTLVGTDAKWLLLGVMLPTWFLSMWMSNTATTAMMMPIVTAILLQVKESQLQDVGAEGLDSNYLEMKETMKAEMNQESAISNRAEKEKKFLGFAKTFSLAVAFSSNIGGMATLTGTPPNVIFKGIADSLYTKLDANNPVDFANWLIVGMPLAVILFVFLWVWMQLYSEGFRCLQFWKKDSTSYEKVRTFPEIMVLIKFIVLAILWVSRKPGFVPGWSDLFLPGYVGDSTPAIAISILLFVLPAKSPAKMWMSQTKPADIFGDNDKDTVYEPLLDWATVNRRMAWGVLLLMGGGFAMAEACQVSGLSSWVSENMESLASLPVWVTALLLSVIVAGITQVTSNAATTTLFVPIVGDLALKMGIHPLYFMIPCTISSSLAFLLPVATPPNAIVFAAGYLHVKDMVLAGLPINILAIIILNLALNSWVSTLYDLSSVSGGLLNSTGNASILYSNGYHNLFNTTVFPVNGSAY
ncbi:unnamed protein product [Candidula unifasciata]|uniref:Solute carrier family 13 member 5 n=1 Tax=Candidula unifasciata TaxID=100452 RepID=A0A8S3Z3W8_9EUPU|nr:unnamed protein product [Candidula unifasciata]